jgi:hypothetical protein
VSLRPARLAWALAGLAIVLHLLSHLFVLLGIGTGTPGDADVTLGSIGHYVGFYVIPLVGAVVAARRPGNAIGWLFLATGLASGLTVAGRSYADYALFAEPGRLPAGAWAGWSALWLDVLFFVFVVLLVLLFPDGRLPSPRWRPVLYALVAGGAGIGLAGALRPGELYETLPVENPAAIGGIATLLDAIEVVAVLVFFPATVAAAVGALLRFRRARGEQRQQFKWFALAASFLLVSFLTTMLPIRGSEEVAHALIGFAFAGLAVAVGVAVLRYRLYDIDRVISKTLVYGSLTVILGATYVGLVLAGHAVLSSFAGGGDLAIAGSTLVVAALFLPARARVQRVVDRRFYRRRYDAQRTLEAFGARLREQTDLERLTGDLGLVVGETLEPAQLSIWIRSAR